MIKIAVANFRTLGPLDGSFVLSKNHGTHQKFSRWEVAPVENSIRRTMVDGSVLKQQFPSILFRNIMTYLLF